METETKKIGLTSNSLKLIAVIFMIIDHFAYYFRMLLNYDIYYSLRMLGRIAMPIFVYTLVQGYFHTKNFWKYVFRIFILAIITQVSFIAIGYINYTIYPTYIIGINSYLNILFSFAFSLMLIYFCDMDKTIIKSSTILNYALKILGVIIIVFFYVNINIDYDYRVPFISLCLFILEKVYKKLKIDKSVGMFKLIYMIAILLIFIVSFYMQDSVLWFNISSLISVVFIALYNDEKGSSNKIYKYLFYLIFPVQHILLYVLGMIISVR